MKIRRFVKKRRQREDRRLADQMSAKHLGNGDRQEVLAFRAWLRRSGGDPSPRTRGALLAQRLAEAPHQ